jgi:hypothetical protein
MNFHEQALSKIFHLRLTVTDSIGWLSLFMVTEQQFIQDFDKIITG